jgi:hypothetical protein
MSIQTPARQLGYKLGSRGIELRETPDVVVGRIIKMMARRELGCARGSVVG